MPRSRRIDRPTRFEVSIPSSIRVAVEAELWSEVEGKVPYGEFGRLIIKLLRDWLVERGLGTPEKYLIRRVPYFSSILWVVVKPDDQTCEVFLTEAEATQWIQSNS